MCRSSVLYARSGTPGNSSHCDESIEIDPMNPLQSIFEEALSLRPMSVLRFSTSVAQETPSFAVQSRPF